MEDPNAVEAPSMEQVIVNQRQFLSSLIRNLEDAEKMARPPVVQEIVLARRHVEDARMRLGVALTYVKGHNPWVNQSEVVATPAEGEAK